MYVNSDHAGDKETWISSTGFMIYMNKLLIRWLSKKQPKIETSVFKAKFVSMKLRIEILRGSRYKLRMMGIPLSGASIISGYNVSVIQNTQIPEYTLRKKIN